MAEDKQEFRSIEDDIRKAMELLLDVHLACTIEMVNMGDWTIHDYHARVKPHEETLEKIQKGESLKNVPDKVWNDVMNTLENSIKVEKYR